MTEKEYRQAEGISRSQLWRLTESPEKFKWYEDHPEEPTPALIFGQLVHKATLEPETLMEEFAVAPNVDRRTKAGKEEYAAFAEDAAGKTIVSADDWQKATEMLEAQKVMPFIKKLLDGEHEKPFFWVDEMTGELCKVRVDALIEINYEGEKRLAIIDYKSTMDASSDAFMRQAVNLGYDFQAAMYSEGVEKVTGRKPLFVFIAQEKTAPYAINILQADPVFIQRGADRFRELIGIYHDCKTSGNWYGYLGKYGVINNLSLPAWLAKEVE